MQWHVIRSLTSYFLLHIGHILKSFKFTFGTWIVSRLPKLQVKVKLFDWNLLIRMYMKLLRYMILWVCFRILNIGVEHANSESHKWMLSIEKTCKYFHFQVTNFCAANEWRSANAELVLTSPWCNPNTSLTTSFVSFWSTFLYPY